MTILKKALLGASLSAAALAAAPANAVTFNLIDTGGTAVGTQARTGFEIAAAYWSSVLTNNATINLQIGFSPLGPGILGSTGSARSLLSMNQGYTALATNVHSSLDAQAVAGLQPLGLSTVSPTFGAVTATANAINATNNGYLSTATRLDNDGGVNNSTLAVTKASAKALGLTTDVNGNAINYNTADAAITFSSNFNFDFDARDGINANAFDFVGVAIHEIGHALGFVSGVDSYDARSAPNGPNATSGLLENFVVMSQLDLFRYSAPGNLDWSTGGTKYMSLDGGLTQLFGDSLFSTGAYNGDGRQASHWKDSPAGQPQLGVMDPTSGFGQMQEVTALDLAAFDVIGWNVNFDVAANQGYRFNTASAYNYYISAVPEPATWASMVMGFGLLGFAMRRVRTRKVAYLA